MANYGIQTPDYSSGGFLGGFQQDQAFGQELADRQTMAKLQQVQLQQATENLALQRATRASLARVAMQDLAQSGPMGGMGAAAAPSMGAPPPDTPMGAFPTPDQVAAQETAHGDKPADIADFAPSNPPPAISPGAPLGPPKASDIHLQEYQRALRNARAVAATDPKLYNDFTKEAEIANGKRTAALESERKDRQNNVETLSNMLGGVKDADSLNDVAKYVTQMFPQDAAILDKIGLQRGPDGQYLWNGTNNPRIVANVAEAVLKQTDRMKRDDLKQQELDRQDRIAEQKRRDDDVARYRDAELAARRDGQALTREVQLQRQQDQREKAAATATNQVNRDLQKDPVYNNFPRFQATADLADSVKRQLSTPEGYATLNASDARALASGFQNAAEGFRNRQGGKYAMQDDKAFNGALQRVQAWADSIGRGTPTFSEDTSRDVANSITRLYNIANKNTLIASYEAVEKVTRKGGDPQDVNVRGNLTAALRSGDAQLLGADGKPIPITPNKPFDTTKVKYLKIGDAKFQFSGD